MATKQWTELSSTQEDMHSYRWLEKDVNNYRLISIIPAVAKIFERIIYNQFYRYLNDNDLSANYQSAFRSLHSTLTTLACLRPLTVGLLTEITVLSIV